MVLGLLNLLDLLLLFFLCIDSLCLWLLSLRVRRASEELERVKIDILVSLVLLDLCQYFSLSGE